MRTLLCFFTMLAIIGHAPAQELQIIDQDYETARTIASQEHKMIFMDLYTSWCVPCKKLDKLVFQNDSIQQILAKDFVFLRYDAEGDTVFNLSKKHHVFSYPTAIILNTAGYVVSRQYGFPGEDYETLSQSVLDFTREGIELNDSHTIIKGYAPAIAMSAYPDFYIDYINRTNTRVTKTQAFQDYWSMPHDPLSEAYFSVLIYFVADVPGAVADSLRQYRELYVALYGKTDTETLFYFLASGKFKRAIADKSEAEYTAAVAYAKAVLSKAWTGDMLPAFEISFLKAQHKWGDVWAIYESQNNDHAFSNGKINHLCWDVYKNCDDPQVIARCMAWMKVVTDEASDYMYWDTYAFLVYKSGNREEAKRVAQHALALTKEQGEKTKSMESLLEKLSEVTE